MSNVFSGVVRLAADAELRVIPSGAGVVTFNAASDTGFGDKKQTLWLRVSCWRNPEKIQPYLLKGSQVFVTGELSQREYEKDGQTRTSLELNANLIDLVGKKPEAKEKPHPDKYVEDEMDSQIPF